MAECEGGRDVAWPPPDDAGPSCRSQGYAGGVRAGAPAKSQYYSGLGLTNSGRPCDGHQGAGQT